MRKSRQKKPDCFYYVASNFHPGVQKYITGWVKKMLLTFIRKAAKKFKIKIKNICIMDTYFHLLIKPEETEDISKIIGWIKQKFTQWLNKIFGLTGTAWTDRFFSKIIDTIEHLQTLFHYISQNAIKAGASFSSKSYPLYQVWDKNLTEL